MNKQISKWFSLLILSSAVFLSVIDIFIVNVAVPSIKKGINGSDADIQLVIALYLLGYAAFLVTGGRVGDYYGKKKVFVTAMVLFTLASCLCGSAQSPFQLNSARLLQGLSAAFMIPQSIAYITLLFPEQKERIKAMGIYGSVAGAASVIGQFLGGILPDTHFVIAGWRLIFLINLPLGAIFSILALRYLRETDIKKMGRFDYAGVLLLTLTLVSLIYPLIRGLELGWPLWSLLSIGFSILLLVIFIYDQKRKTRIYTQRTNGKGNKEPLINMELFTYRDFNIGLCAVFFYFMVQDSYFLINAVLFQTGFGISSSETGLFFVFQGVGYVTAAVISIRLVPVYDKKVLQAGVGIMITALILHLLFFNSVPVNYYMVLPIMFVYGIGCGSVLPSLMTLALKRIPGHFAGVASGTYSTFQQTSIALGICGTGGIFFYKLTAHPVLDDYISAYQTATFANIILLVLVGVCLLVMPGKTEKTSAEKHKG